MTGSFTGSKLEMFGRVYAAQNQNRIVAVRTKRFFEPIKVSNDNMPFIHEFRRRSTASS